MIQTGDSIGIRNPKNFISRQICAVMKKWAKKKGYDKIANYDPDLIYSHFARLVWIGETLYVCGSIDSGYRPWELNLHYNLESDQYVLMRRNVDLTEDEKIATVKYCLHLIAVSKLYQYWNFIQWLLLVYLNIDTFRKDSDGYTYCYESERMARKQLNPEFYGETYKTDQFQLIYDSNYHIYYKNK